MSTKELHEVITHRSCFQYHSPKYAGYAGKVTLSENCRHGEVRVIVPVLFSSTIARNMPEIQMKKGPWEIMDTSDLILQYYWLQHIDK